MLSQSSPVVAKTPLLLHSAWSNPGTEQKKKVKWCIYIAPFPCNMLKGALQWSVYPQRTGSIYRRLWQPLQIGPCMLVLILPTPGGWKAEWTLAGKKVTQIFNPPPGRESNRGPQDWEAEILTTAPTPPLLNSWRVCCIQIHEQSSWIVLCSHVTDCFLRATLAIHCPSVP